MNGIEIKLLDWTEAAPLAMPLRERVFVVEQGVPADLELDEYDAVSCHAVAIDERGAVVATGRLLPDGHIGRMAVTSAWRKRGVGGRVLEALAEEGCRRGLDRLVLNAQVSAMPFYRRHGFVAEGETFIEAGIEHQAMHRSCSGG